MARYQDLLQQIEQLKQEAESVRRAELQTVINEIKEKMAQHGITVADLGGRGGRGGKKSKVAPKYRDPASGETWSGRGRLPRWLAEAEAAGKSRDSFLID